MDTDKLKQFHEIKYKSNARQVDEALQNHKLHHSESHVDHRVDHSSSIGL